MNTNHTLLESDLLERSTPMASLDAGGHGGRTLLEWLDRETGERLHVEVRGSGVLLRRLLSAGFEPVDSVPRLGPDGLLENRIGESGGSCIRKAAPPDSPSSPPRNAPGDGAAA